MSTPTSSPFAQVLLIVALAPGAAATQAPSPAGDSPALTALIDEALARNPELQAAEAALRAARERPAQARALRDPGLSLNYTNEGWSPSLGDMPNTTLALMLSQELPWPGKRRLRGELAAREADVVEQRLSRARLGVTAAVRRAHAGLLQARALLELTREQAEVWRQIEGVARARYAVGQGNQQDVLRTQVELTRVGQAVVEQEAGASVRQAELNGLLDRPADAALASDEVLGPLAAGGPLAEELARLAARSPERHAARAAIDGARLGLELARKEFQPDLTLQGGYMSRGGLEPMWQAGVAINLPLRRERRASAVAEAEAQLLAAEARLRSVELLLRFRTQERLAQLEAAATTAALYRDGIVPQDRLSLEAAIASYQAGRTPFLTVLEALTTMYMDRGTLLRLLASGARIRASLEEASLEATSELPALALPALSTERTGAGAMGSMSR